jgi:DNA-binding NtrC family response regulator
MDGYDLYHNIKKLDNKVKVCFFSASEPSSNEHKKFIESKESKEFHFIQKPIAIKEMMEQIKSILS